METDELTKTRNNVVVQSARLFSERLNRCLDDMEAPAQARARTVILSKVLDISKQDAWDLLDGMHLPDSNLLLQIANEFDVDPQWLAGNK